MTSCGADKLIKPNEKEAKKMKVLITGGAGYIGSHCVQYFQSMGIETVVMDDLSTGHEEAALGAKFIKGDIGDACLLTDLMRKEGFDAVVHLAALASVAESQMYPGRYYDNNVSKMATLLDCAVLSGIGFFVYSSSAAVFGEPKYVPIDENHPMEPINTYGRTKLIGEMMLADFQRAHGIRFCALRYFNASGALPDGRIGESHEPETHLIPLVMRAAREGKTLKVFGGDYSTRDGSCLRDYIHVEDLAHAHYLGLKHIMGTGQSECFNLGSSEGITVLEIIKEVEKLTGNKIDYEISARRSGDPAALVASNEKAKRLLGWTPKHSGITEILGDAWNWEQKKRF